MYVRVCWRGSSVGRAVIIKNRYFQLYFYDLLQYRPTLLLLLLLLYNMYVSCRRHFFLVLLLNQRWAPPLRLQASHCSTFRIVCDVPSIAVFCSESIECFPGTVSKFFFKLLVTIPVAPIIIIIIIIIRYGCLLSQAFSSWYFSWTSGDPHRSGFKLHIAVLSVLCVMFQV